MLKKLCWGQARGIFKKKGICWGQARGIFYRFQHEQTIFNIDE